MEFILRRWITLLDGYFLLGRSIKLKTCNCSWILCVSLPKQTLLEYAEKWKTSEDPLPLLEVYTVAIRSYVKARPYLTSECENVAFVLERLALWVFFSVTNTNLYSINFALPKYSQFSLQSIKNLNRLVVWVNPVGQLSTTQLLADFPPTHTLPM